MTERKIITITICIIIIILLLFFLVKHLGVINAMIPMGNVDIFDINFIEIDEENKEDINSTNGTNDSNNNIENNISQEKFQVSISDNYNSENGKVNQEENGVLIYDKNTQYTNKTKLKIFENKSYFVRNDRIAPGSQNSYQFIIRNNNDFAITYYFKINEENQHGIDMRYRLKCNGEYIIGNDQKWVTVEELTHDNINLANKSYNTYTLDWKWFEGDNKTDTEIGKNIDANYNLNIEFFANRY